MLDKANGLDVREKVEAYSLWNACLGEVRLNWSVFLPFILFFLPRPRKHRSQKSQRTFLIESNDHESFLYIKWNTFACLPRDKVIKTTRERPRNSCCPCNTEIKNQGDKLVVQYFFPEQSLSELPEPTYKETENRLHFWHFKIQILSTKNVCSSEETVCYTVLLSGI